MRFNFITKKFDVLEMKMITDSKKKSHRWIWFDFRTKEM